MFCVNCGNKLPEDAKFCSRCGTKIVSNDDTLCPNCGSRVAAGSNFCTECGAKIEASGEDAVTAKAADAKASSVLSQQEVELNYKRGKECLEGGVTEAALKYFKIAAGQGHAEAQYQLAKMYQSGEALVGLPKSNSRQDMDKYAAAMTGSEMAREKHAMKWYALAAKQGHAKAQYELAMQYLTGGALLDYPKLEDAIRMLGDTYGVSVKTKFQEILNMYLIPVKAFEGISSKDGMDAAEAKVKGAAKAAETAYKALTEEEQKAFEEAVASVEKSNFEIAFQLLTLSADQGVGAALYELGEIYDMGDDVPQDTDKARELYLKAVAAGNRKAIINLAALDLRIHMQETNWEDDRNAFLGAVADFYKKMNVFLEEEHIQIVNVYPFDSKTFDKKLKGALTYSVLRKGEMPLFIIDTTIFGSAKEGALFTTYGIHSKRAAAAPKDIAYKDVESVFISAGGLSYYITVNGDEVGTGFNTIREAKIVHDIMKSLIDSFKKREL